MDEQNIKDTNKLGKLYLKPKISIKVLVSKVGSTPLTITKSLAKNNFTLQQHSEPPPLASHDSCFLQKISSEIMC